MRSQCKWVNNIANQSRKKEVDDARKILEDPEVGVLHIFGDRGIGKRTLVQCLAHRLLSGESDFTDVFISDLLSDPLVLEKWNAERCDWSSDDRLRDRSLTGVLEVLFPDYSDTDDTANLKESRDEAKNNTFQIRFE